MAEAPAYLAPPSGPDLAGPAVESEGREPELEHDTPQLPQAISDAVERKDWPRVLELALQVGWHDENQLTNLLFFGRHPELGRRPLDPKHSAKDRTLAAEWTRVLRAEVRPVPGTGRTGLRFAVTLHAGGVKAVSAKVRVQLRSDPHGEAVARSLVAYNTGYALLYSAAAISAAALIFERRNLK